MAVSNFNYISFLIRLGFSLLLVFATFNPSGYSFYHWVIESWPQFHALTMLSGMVLLIGWVVYLRATVRSLNTFGLILATALFGSMLWLLIERGLVSMDDKTILGYVVLIILSAILAVGMSWSHIRRRMTGQHDVDEIEE